MQSFGEYFKRYLDENSLSYNSVAKKCGIDRTILSKYANGIMKPKNQKVVLRIVKGIEMPKIKAEMLCEIYKKEMICEKYGLEYELIEEFYNLKDSILNTEDIEQQNRFCVGQQYAENLTSYSDILSVMQYLLQDISFVKMSFRSECEKIQNILNQEFFYKSDCSMEQIIVFPKKCTIKEKLKNFNEKFASLVHMKEGTIYYKYTDNYGKYCYSWIPNYIMTNKGILFFDNNLKQGFFSNQQPACDFYKEIFDMQKEECRIFASVGNELYKMLQGRSMDCNIANKRTDVCFSYSDEDTIWIALLKKQQMICIREWELVQLLKEML